MSVNEILEETLSGVVKQVWPLCCPEETPPEEYIVYNPEIEEASLYGDNKDLEWVQYMQVHLFTKKNYIKKRREIRKVLRKNGFIVTDIETMYENDSKYYHLCFSCYIEEKMEE